MNARQKAKRYKRLYEELKNRPFVDPVPIKTTKQTPVKLRTQIYVNNLDIEYMTPQERKAFIENAIINQFCESDVFRGCVNVRTEEKGICTAVTAEITLLAEEKE